MSVWVTRRQHAESPARFPTAVRIIKAHAERVGVSYGAFVAVNGRAAARRRWAAMAELREVSGLSLPQIARAFGMKDHTSVLYGLREHAKLAGQR